MGWPQLSSLICLARVLLADGPARQRLVPPVAHTTRKPLLRCAHLLLHGFMGELIDVGGGLQGGFGLVSGAVSLLALGLYAVLSGRPENDDDDSNPGGGLMQPVA